MTITTNSLARLRTLANIHLHDLAYLLKIDPGNLKKIEEGQLEPSLKIILICHMLFKVPLELIFTDLYADIHAQTQEQSLKLIAQLKRTQSPKSIYRLQSIKNIVKTLNNEDHEFVN